MVVVMLIGSNVFYPRADLWMAYIDFERRQDVLRVGELYWRATMALNEDLLQELSTPMYTEAANILCAICCLFILKSCFHLEQLSTSI